MRRFLLAWFAVGFAAVSTAQAKHSANDLYLLAQRVTSPDEAVAQATIEKLRSAGPAGLDALFSAHDDAIRAHRPLRKQGLQAPSKETLTPKTVAMRDAVEWSRIYRALDEVGGQRHCHASHLYWHTDLEQAKAAAARERKPILSLRLLGKLTDELSCANSRFFRTTLYANEEISGMLRERFVLHWQTVRPAPVVTIDFGDGRALQRTVTGNSAHYVLDAQGRPLDALPGLYGPKAFISFLEKSSEFAQRLRSEGSWDLYAIRKYHLDQQNALDGKWRADMRKLGGIDSLDLDDGSIEELMDHPLWGKLATLHAGDAQLDMASRMLIANQNPRANVAGAAAVSKSVVENPLVRMIASLQQTIAIDTVRNEYLLQRRIHEWFAKGQAGDVDNLTTLVYAQLFLTPHSDPWLGLYPQGYTGLENDGVVTTAQR